MAGATSGIYSETGYIHAQGGTVPTDGDTGFAPGCKYVDSDSTLLKQYINDGDKDSCDFNEDPSCYALFTTALTSDDVGKAVTISANNTVSLGADGGVLLGKLLAVSGTTAKVKVRGLMTFDLAAGATTDPGLNEQVIIDGTGKVYQAATDADVNAGGYYGRGHVVSVTADTSCTVLL